MRVDSGDLLCSPAYANNLVLLADSAKDLHSMVNKVSSGASGGDFRSTK
jgi:hypothetical protein